MCCFKFTAVHTRCHTECSVGGLVGTHTVIGMHIVEHVYMYGTKATLQLVTDQFLHLQHVCQNKLETLFCFFKICGHISSQIQSIDRVY
jgi:hypothetical protein